MDKKIQACYNFFFIHVMGFTGQGRLDGAFCDFSENDKMEYLNKIHKSGVVNIEMESLSFAALTHHAGVKSAVICVTLMDRLKGDQVSRLSSNLIESLTTWKGKYRSTKITN